MEHLIEYSLRERFGFREEFIWYIVRELAMQLMPYQLYGLVHGFVRPSNAVFYGGELQLKENGTTINTVISQFYTPPDTAPSVKYDVFSLGQIIYIMTGNSPQYSSSLRILMSKMNCMDPGERLTVAGVLQQYNSLVSENSKSVIEKFHNTYPNQAKIHAIEYDNMRRRHQRELEESEEKRRELREKENGFFFNKQVVKK